MKKQNIINIKINKKEDLTNSLYILLGILIISSLGIYVSKKLEKAKIVKSKKGDRGGYFLGKKPSKIKTGDIIRVLEGRTTLVKCLPRGCYCPREKKCLTKSFWGKIQKTLDSALNSITLADLIK